MIVKCGSTEPPARRLPSAAVPVEKIGIGSALTAAEKIQQQAANRAAREDRAVRRIISAPIVIRS
jgi:hypothetical protein